MRNRRWRGYTVMAAIALTATACGTRLPNSAFVSAEGGNGTASGTRSGATAKAGTGPTTTAPAAAAGVGPGASGGPTAPGPGGAAAPGATGADGPNQASDTGVTENEIVIGNITAVDGILIRRCKT